MIRRPPRSTQSRSSAASDVYKRQSKGRSLKQAKAAAFATAHKHKEEGMPTRGSKRFSNNGRRLNFITESTKASKEIDLTAELILDSLNLEGIKILDSFEKSIR